MDNTTLKHSLDGSHPRLAEFCHGCEKEENSSLQGGHGSSGAAELEQQWKHFPSLPDR